MLKRYNSMNRSDHPESTRSRPISEVKLGWAGPVLWTEMTREAPVTILLPLKTAFPFFFAGLLLLWALSAGWGSRELARRLVFWRVRGEGVSCAPAAPSAADGAGGQQRTGGVHSC